MKDALGNDVELGKAYGYSTTDNVIVGIATQFAKEKVTITPTKRRFFRYGEEEEQGSWQGNAKTISIWSYHLFPVAT